jgi:hypothetical protein
MNNTDETVLFYKLMPSRTLAFKEERCTEGKRLKEKIKVFLCIYLR